MRNRSDFADQVASPARRVDDQENRVESKLLIMRARSDEKLRTARPMRRLLRRFEERCRRMGVIQNISLSCFQRDGRPADHNHFDKRVVFEKQR